MGCNSRPHAYSNLSGAAVSFSISELQTPVQVLEVDANLLTMHTKAYVTHKSRIIAMPVGSSGSPRQQAQGKLSD